MKRIAKEYAEALFMLGLEKKAEKKYYTALTTVSEQMEKYPEYQSFLLSPSVSVSERVCALDQAFVKAIDDEVLSFLKILVESGRFELFPLCVKEYSFLLSAKENEVTARVKSATKLTEKQKTVLKEKLEKTSGKKVIIENVINPQLIGGIIVEFDDKIIDASIKTMLNEVKGEILK